mmetsp:Transcript_74233/g.187038  ORF Transcript_74233/g.187038 Transcript_74233/m.187038 type:complete len:146 (+) Transcript_74233:507-944(+)
MAGDSTSDRHGQAVRGVDAQRPKLLQVSESTEVCSQLREESRAVKILLGLQAPKLRRDTAEQSRGKGRGSPRSQAWAADASTRTQSGLDLPAAVRQLADGRRRQRSGQSTEQPWVCLAEEGLQGGSGSSAGGSNGSVLTTIAVYV